MFSMNLRNAGHSRRYSICSREGLGWEVTREEDREVTRHAYYHGWHRVERELAVFEREVPELTAHGWRKVESEPGAGLFPPQLAVGQSTKR